MTEHTQKLIVMQTLVKEILPVVFEQPGTRWLDEGIRQETEKWCHWAYDLAGRIGPQDQNTDTERMHPNTVAAAIKRILEYIRTDDSLGLLEMRDEFRQGQWAWIVQRLYTHDAKRMKELLSEGEALMGNDDED